MVRAILSRGERTFLNNIPSMTLNSNERHKLRNIINKTQNVWKDLDLIFQKIPSYKVELFSDEELPSIKKPVEEVTKILYEKNYYHELRRIINEEKVRGDPDKQVVCERTKNQMIVIIDSVLNELVT